MSPQQSIGHYRITSKLGEGGMGAVYRATDTRLNRDVALKVLPEAFRADADRMARFEREAQMLAALNHSNIAAIYGIEQGAIVMELVEGEDLAGPLPIDTAIAYARQIAFGLEAAHEKGIIHRDLKPANIKVTSEGVVKLLDFGLAKATEETGGNPVNSPTMSLTMTQAGVILGTAAYMAPEQARGKTVDKRADIWAFGVVFYEMLTGRDLYGGGETITDVIAAVVTREPDWNSLPAGTPPRVRRLLERCLRKDPKQRLRDIGEARVLLDEPEAAPSATVEKAPRRKWLAWAMAAVIPIAAAAGWWARPLPPAPALAIRFDIVAAPGGDFMTAGHAVSPDGQRMVLRTRPPGNIVPRLYLRHLNGTELRELPGTEGASRPAWSPDGRSIVFAAGGKWQRLELAGGSPRALCDVGQTARGAAWSERGIILIAQPAGPIRKIPADGGAPVAVTKLNEGEGETRHAYPHFLPGGRFFLYTESGTRSSAWVADVDGKEPPKRLIDVDGYETVYAAGATPGAGMLLFRRGESLMAVRFDEKRLAITSDVFPVLDRLAGGVLNDLPVAVSSPARVMLADASQFSAREELALVDRSGKKQTTMTSPGEMVWGHLEFSPDGKRLVGSRGVASVDLWSVDLARGTVSRITSSPSYDKAPAWSPDGKKIYYMSMRGEDAGVWVTASDGAGKPELLLKAIGHHIGASPDGRLVAFEHRASDQSLALLDVSHPGKAEPLIGGSSVLGWPQFSPDGRWLAYISNETGRQEVYIQSYPPGRGKTQVSRDGGRLARWRADGRELVFASGSGYVSFFSVAIKPRGEELAVEAPVKLFEIGMSERAGGNYFALSPDARRIALNLTERNAGRPLTVLVDWMAALGAKR